MNIEGACHCGNITFELHLPGDSESIPARACGCTFCTKHGGVWTSSPDGTLTVTIGDDALVSTYRFGTATADFHVCSRCGVAPFVTSVIDGRQYAVVNVNTFENVEPSRLETSGTDFEGEDREGRLARRARNWIPHVRLDASGAGTGKS